MSTIRFHLTTTSTPEQFIAGLTAFGPGRSTPTLFDRFHELIYKWALLPSPLVDAIDALPRQLARDRDEIRWCR